MDEDEILEGEVLDLPEDETAVVDTDDGGAIVRLGEDDDEGFGGHFDNLAETLPEYELSAIGTQLIELIERDKEARKGRDEQQEEGLRRTGLGDDAPGGAQFNGASRVVHPMLVEACIDFSARAIKELFPSEGPVKDKILGDVTEVKAAKAKRKTRLMNWQLTEQAKDMRGELEQLLTQLPLGGGQYLKCSWDDRRNRPTFLFVPIDDMLLPFAATNFYSAHRKTHVQYITALEYEQRVRSGMYRDVDIVASGTEPDETLSGKANDKIEGRAPSSYNEDGLRTVFEVYIEYDIEADTSTEGSAPYIITVDKTTNKVLAIYRNWAEDDESREPLDWFVEFPFIPWRGAYPIGLPQIIGGLSASATGALRALLDSAHISNQASMLKLKGGQIGGQNISVNPGEVTEIEGGLNVDDIRKLAMPMPFNPPSPVLFQLLGFLTEAARGVVRTALDNIADQNPNAPVGTTLAQIEQGMVVFSAIHERLHFSMARLLGILHRLNATNLDDENIRREAGDGMAKREDFLGAQDVVPISDPRIFSDTQRFAQMQAVAQRSQLAPDLYDRRKVEQRILETLRIPAADELLLPATTPIEQNAIDENVAASLGKPIAAYKRQDHIAHIKAHVAYALHPLFGLNPMVAPALVPAMINHLKEHMVLWYAQQAEETAGELAGVDLHEAIKEHNDSETRAAFDAMLAETGQEALTAAMDVFAELGEALQQLQQVAASFPPAQQGPTNPLAIQQAEVQRKAAADQQAAQLKQADMQLRAQEAAQRNQLAAAKLQQEAALAQQDQQADMQREAIRQQAEDARNAEDNQTALAINTQDNQTAMHIAEAEIVSGENVALSTGGGINPGV